MLRRLVPALIGVLLAGRARYARWRAFTGDADITPTGVLAGQA